MRYGSLTAVDDVSFDVPTGRVFGLLGPNGAGKTSVVRALTTVISPERGEAVVGGVPLSDPDLVRRRIGVLPESNGFPHSVTALDHLSYFGRLFGMGATDSLSAARLLLANVGLDSAAHQTLGSFSRGMRQRFGIARALLNSPRVVFLDEPTLGLDPAGREDVLSLLSRITNDEGASVVLCSHLLDDVERVCDRVGILDRGRMVVQGTVRDVIASAGVVGTVRVRVNPEQLEDAAQALSVINPGVTPDRSGSELEVRSDEPENDVNGVLSALLSAGVEVHGVALRRARLSDAFLSLTGRS